ncbi:MAG: enoyl-CoA hydratase/isomerase family protein [Acetobacteraceae bacterium]
MPGTVRSETATGGVRVITLDRPERLNAIVPELLGGLIAALEAAARDPAVGAIVLTGAGRAFCAGDDLKEFSAQSAGEATARAYVTRIQDVTRAIMLGRVPVIAAVRGWAVGGGLEWMLNCDFAIAAEGSRFFFPELAWGMFVTGGATALLPRLVGLGRARELIMLGERFEARAALAWGLVWKVVADEALMEEAVTLARRIAALPAEPVRALRKILAAPGLAAAMDAETEATVKAFLDPETARLVSRFR